MATMTPFQLFGMKPAFRIDESRLETAYQAAMMKVHPDRFADRPAAERRVAEQWSSRINEAYMLLKNPVTRAGWLCEAAGVPVNAETNTAMPADFLMMQIDWREALEAAAGDKAATAKLQADTEAFRDELVSELAAAIDERAEWPRAVDLTRRLMFVRRFLEDVNAQMQAL